MTITITPAQHAAVAITDAVESASADGTLNPTVVAHVAELVAALPDRTRIMAGLDYMVQMDGPVRERRALSTLRVAILATCR